MSAFKLSAQAHEAILGAPLVDDKAMALALNERVAAPANAPLPAPAPQNGAAPAPR